MNIFRGPHKIYFSKMEHDHVKGCQFDNFLIVTKLTTFTPTERNLKIIYYTLRYISYYAHNAARFAMGHI